LKKVVPVAEANKVRLCCIRMILECRAARVFRGVERVLGSVEGLKKFVEINASPYHGLNFCQGTVCEMLGESG